MVLSASLNFSVADILRLRSYKYRCYWVALEAFLSAISYSLVAGQVDSRNTGELILHAVHCLGFSLTVRFNSSIALGISFFLCRGGEVYMDKGTFIICF